MFERKLIKLPWPPAILNPNARPHRMNLARAKKVYRRDCGWAAKAQGLHAVDWPFAGVVLTFYPPNRRGDDDNAVAAFKSGRDGVSDVLGVDDRNWRVIYRWGEVVKGGCVLVDISQHDGSVVPYIED